MITVAKDGSGDYTCVQEAIDSITSVPETVFIKNGIIKTILHSSVKMQTAR